MLPPLAYLAWAIENYGLVKYDLATSGMPNLAAERVGPPAELLARATDVSAPALWVQAIARRFGVASASVVPTLGTTHGLWATYAALLSPGDDVVVESPAYEPLVRLAEGLGARVVSFARPLSRGAALDPAAIERAITTKTRLVAITNLHNPTGAYAPDEVIESVAAVTRRAGVPLLVDEVYRDLVDYDPTRGRTAFHLGAGIVTTSSLTKVYGLGWARAGWVLAEPHLAKRIFDATLHTAGGTSYALASIGAIALDRIADLYAISAQQRAGDDALAARLSAFVAARPNLSWSRAPGSIFGFVVDRRGVDLRAAIERAIRQEQVIVAPGVFFGAPSGFRIRYGALPIELLDEGLARLGRALDRAP